MSPIAKAFFLVCNLETMTVSLTEIRWMVSFPIPSRQVSPIFDQTIIQEVEARGFQVVR
jgi:hypothetical protein